jgi:hypothetical protein
MPTVRLLCLSLEVVETRINETFTIGLLTSCANATRRRRDASRAQAGRWQGAARRIHWTPQLRRLRCRKGETWQTTSAKLDHLRITRSHQLNFHLMILTLPALVAFEVASGSEMPGDGRLDVSTDLPAGRSFSFSFCLAGKSLVRQPLTLECSRIDFIDFM